MDDDLLTVEEAAKKLRLHLDTARRFVREGKLSATKVGRRYLIPASAIREFIQSGFVDRQGKESGSGTAGTEK